MNDDNNLESNPLKENMNPFTGEVVHASSDELSKPETIIDDNEPVTSNNGTTNDAENEHVEIVVTASDLYSRSNRISSPKQNQPQAGENSPKPNISIVDNRDWSHHWEAAAAKILETNEKLTVTVGSPELVSTMMSKHVVYSVKTEPCGYCVRRRYNDFNWLRETLLARFEGLFVPMLPSTTTFSAKYVGGSKTDVTGDFVKNRMAQLNFFMQQILKIPFLRTDPAFNAFVSLQNEKQFKQMTDAQPPSPISRRASVTATTVSSTAASTAPTNQSAVQNDGLTLWFEIMEICEINMETERMISDFKRQLDQLRLMFDAVQIQCRDAGRKALASALSMHALSEQMHKWKDLEIDLLDPHKNECINSNAGKIKLYMSGLVTGHYHWSQNISTVPRILARIIMSNIQFQQVQIEGFRNHLLMRDNVAKELDKAQKELHRIVEDKAKAALQANTSSSTSNKFKMFSKGADELEDAFQKKTEQVNNLTQILNRITRGLLFCEIDRFNKERLQSTANLLASLSATNMQLCQTSNSKWSQIIGDAGLDNGDYFANYSNLHNVLDAASNQEDSVIFEEV